MTQQTCRRAEQSLPDTSAVWPVSAHIGTSQQWGHRLVKQEVGWGRRVDEGKGSEDKNTSKKVSERSRGAVPMVERLK